MKSTQKQQKQEMTPEPEPAPPAAESSKKKRKHVDRVFKPVPQKGVVAIMKDIDSAMLMSEETANLINDHVLAYTGSILEAANKLRKKQKTKTLLPKHIRTAIAIKVPEVEGEDDCVRSMTLSLIDRMEAEAKAKSKSKAGARPKKEAGETKKTVSEPPKKKAKKDEEEEEEEEEEEDDDDDNDDDDDEEEEEDDE